MRIFILFTDEPVFHPKILHQMVLGYNGEIVGVGGVSHHRGSESAVNYIMRQIGFWGWRGFIVNVVSIALHKLLDLFPLPTYIVGFHSLEAVCKEYKIPYQKVPLVNERLFLDYLGAQDIDVIISSQGQIFKDRILELPKCACINCHNALLPAYGGLKPAFWAMLNGEEYTGVTTHRMTKNIDEGEVLFQCRVKIRPNQSLFSLYKDLFELNAISILNAIDVLKGKRLALKYNETLNPSYFGEPSREDIKLFQEHGFKMA